MTLLMIHDPITNWITVFGVIAFYLLPLFLAFARGHASRWAILIVTVLLGWTVLGWFIALIWAASNPHRGNTITVNVSR